MLGKDGARVLFFYSGRRQVVDVHAFQKKVQKIPIGELLAALNRKDRHERRASAKEKS